MIRSMTGFAQEIIMLQDSQGTQISLTLSLKSLNSRFFEATCKLPHALTALETECIKLFRASLHRGSITFIVQGSVNNLGIGTITVDMTMAKNYLSGCKKLQESYNIPGSITINDLVRIPTLFVMHEGKLEPEVQKTIMQAVQRLITRIQETRLEEGTALKKDLLQRIEIMKKILHDITQNAEQIMQQRKKEVSEKLATLGSLSTEFAESQRTALYLELDKIDIHEEIVRFSTHLNNFAQQIESLEEEKGRKLDFILQELAREINTIAAKGSNARISSDAINVKVELEKAREQVQNIV